jgi:hypothetical protein
MLINVVVEVPDNFEQRLDMQSTIEAEIKADRWSWNYGMQLYGSFGNAIANMKNGKKVARLGWNGKGMFIFLVEGSEFKVSRAPLNKIYPEGTDIIYRPHIDMKGVDGSISVWNPTNNDCLAEDWVIVE